MEILGTRGGNVVSATWKPKDPKGGHIASAIWNSRGSKAEMLLRQHGNLRTSWQEVVSAISTPADPEEHLSFRRYGLLGAQGGTIVSAVGKPWVGSRGGCPGLWFGKPGLCSGKSLIRPPVKSLVQVRGGPSRARSVCFGKLDCVRDAAVHQDGFGRFGVGAAEIGRVNRLRPTLPVLGLTPRGVRKTAWT